MTNSPASGSADLALVRVSKTFPGGTLAVDDLTLEVVAGELMVLLGPSGCGKSTVLRMIAGLEDVTLGRIELAGRVLNNVAERERDIAMVFQSYALYPHMSVRGNIGYPLRHGRPRVGKRERMAQVESVAHMLGLDGVLDRKPAQLSGGQRQRVAMGRAMVREPKLFLLDEPFSNLDAALRVQLRTEIHALQRRLGTAMLFVTHDQVEAMTLGDRVAVLRDGVLQQVGRPLDVYQRPANVFVAAFMGTPGMSLFPAPLVSTETGLGVQSGSEVIRLDASEVEMHPKIINHVGRSVIVGLRSEDLSVAGRTSDGRRLRGTLRLQEELGASLMGYFAIDGLTHDGDVAGLKTEISGDAGAPSALVGSSWLLPGRFPASTHIAEGSRVELAVQPGGLRFFDPETGEAI